jgi:hypothetical protein
MKPSTCAVNVHLSSVDTSSSRREPADVADDGAHIALEPSLIPT